MTNQINASYLISKYFIVISIIVVLLHYVLKYMIKLIERKLAEDEFYSNHPTLNPYSSAEEKIAFHIQEVKELAQKISEEKEELESYQLFNEEYLTSVLEKYSTFRKQIECSLTEEKLKNQTRFEQMEEVLLKLQDEISVYKSEVEQLVKTWQSPNIQTEKHLKYRKLLAESAVQTEESYSVACDEIFSELSDGSLLALKDCAMLIARESETTWVNEVLKFFETLEENYKSIKSLIISSWEEISIEISTCSTILDKVQKVEQTVFGILIFLQQQSVDAQTVRETLKFFDHRFGKFMKRSEARWQKSCSKLDYAFGCVRKTQEFMNDSSSAFSDTSMTVAQQLTCLNLLIKEFSGVAKLIYDAEYLTSSVEKNVCDLVLGLTSITSKIDKDYCRKLNELFEVLLKPGEKLYILYKTTEDLHIFMDFLKQAPLNSAPLTLPTKPMTSSASNSINRRLNNALTTGKLDHNSVNVIEEAEGIQEKQINQPQTSHNPCFDDITEKINKVYTGSNTSPKKFSCSPCPEDSPETKSEPNVFLRQESSSSKQTLKETNSDYLLQSDSSASCEE